MKRLILLVLCLLLTVSATIVNSANGTKVEAGISSEECETVTTPEELSTVLQGLPQASAYASFFRNDEAESLAITPVTVTVTTRYKKNGNTLSDQIYAEGHVPVIKKTTEDQTQACDSEVYFLTDAILLRYKVEIDSRREIILELNSTDAEDGQTFDTTKIYFNRLYESEVRLYVTKGKAYICFDAFNTENNCYTENDAGEKNYMDNAEIATYFTPSSDKLVKTNVNDFCNLFVFNKEILSSVSNVEDLLELERTEAESLKKSLGVWFDLNHEISKDNIFRDCSMTGEGIYEAMMAYSETVNQSDEAAVTAAAEKVQNDLAEFKGAQWGDSEMSGVLSKVDAIYTQYQGLATVLSNGTEHFKNSGDIIYKLSGADLTKYGKPFLDTLASGLTNGSEYDFLSVNLANPQSPTIRLKLSKMIENYSYVFENEYTIKNIGNTNISRVSNVHKDLYDVMQNYIDKWLEMVM